MRTIFGRISTQKKIGNHYESWQLQAKLLHSPLSMNFKLPLNLRDDFASQRWDPRKQKTFWIKIVTWIQRRKKILFLCKNAHVNSILKPKCYKLQILSSYYHEFSKQFHEKKIFWNEQNDGFLLWKDRKCGNPSLNTTVMIILTPFFWFL